MLNIKVQKLSNTAIIPTYGSNQSACFDLYADIVGTQDIDIGMDNYRLAIPPHQTVKISTGLAFQPPNGYCGLIFARSGLSSKEGLRPANCVGVCDEDYTGEYIVALHNDSEETRIVKHGDRIAQLVLQKRYDMDFEEVEELEETERGAGGFGSTGKR